MGGVSLGKTIAKALPVGGLLAFVLAAFTPSAALITALACAVIGDILVSRSDRRVFALGMAAFGLAHAALIAVFVEEGLSLEAMRWVAAAGILVGAAGMAAILVRPAGGLGRAVLAYICVIAVMAVVAMAIDTGAADRDRLILIAVALFLASDALLGLLTFRIAEGSPLHVPFDLIIWPAYYGAMALFALSTGG
ncbi:MAG: lysoplasmalogenase family protein [Pseudomonadota bacterium]